MILDQQALQCRDSYKPAMRFDALFKLELQDLRKLNLAHSNHQNLQMILFLLLKFSQPLTSLGDQKR